MSDIDVGPNSSVEDLEYNRVIVQLLLDTLDPCSDDFNFRQDELNVQLQYCEQLLAASQARPHSPGTTTSPTLPNSASLPSRSRPTIPDWGDHYTSPSRSRSYNNAAVDVGLANYTSQDSTTPAVSNGARKRHRTHSSSGQASHNTKAPRITQGSRPASSSASESANELEEITVLPNTDVYELFKKRQEEHEKRWQQELRDKELARQLSQQIDLPPNIASTSNFNQSYMNHDGSFTRPQSGPFSQPQSNGVWTSNPLNTPNVKSEPQHVANPVQDNVPFVSTQAPTSDSDDSVELISPQQFLSSQFQPHGLGSTSFQLPSASEQYGTYNIANAYPNYQQAASATHPALPNNFSGAYNLSNPGPFYDSSEDNTLQNRMMDSFKNFVGGIAGHISGTTTFDGSHQSQHPNMEYHGRAGASVFDEDSDEEPYGYNGFTDRHLDDINSRGFGYMLSDPSKTKEEITQLLENIRPDEELPADLREGGPDELKVALMEHQKVGLTWLKNQEESTNKGSILADDMGLGKTIQAIALILSRRSPNRAVKTTLIVAPVALLRQWKREIETKLRPQHRLSVHIYHGSGASKKFNYARLASFDVVLTTYGTLGSELKRRFAWEAKKVENPSSTTLPPDLSLLGDNCRWWRVILDEAQAIKGRNTNAAVAACGLQAEHRLVMTGTPMMNNIDELYSLIKFLRIPPYNDQKRFTKAFKPLKTNCSERVKQRAMSRLQAVLKAVLLRRTKESKIDDKPILNLTDRTVGEDNAEFDEDQQAFYDHIEQKSRLQFNKYLKAGTIGKNYSNILVLLLRLRQACDHPHLIQDHGIPVEAEASEEQMERFAANLSDGAVQRIKDANGAFECPICYDASENPTIFFPCGHDVCVDCFARMLDPSVAMQRGEESNAAKCPECRQNVDPHRVLTYNLFKKIHLPDVYKQEFGEDALAADPSETDSDSDSESSIDERDDVDEYGNLDGFVVRDDEADEASETEDDTQEPWTKIEPDEAETKFNVKLDDSKPKAKREASKRKNKAKMKRKSKGKGKAKISDGWKSLAQLRVEGRRNATAKKKYMKRLRKNYVSSAKIDKSMKLLEHIRDDDPSEKIIIFSQFTSFLDLFEVPLDDRKWAYQRYDGSMNAKARHAAVERFAEDPACNIMLISLKAGNAGLNLNCASQVIILDPFWNPFIEEQAIDRAHRIGQMRDVHVHRMLIQGTVEDRIVALQEKKRTLINQALDEKAGQKLSRLGREELIFLFGRGEGDEGDEG